MRVQNDFDWSERWMRKALGEMEAPETMNAAEDCAESA